MKVKLSELRTYYDIIVEPLRETNHNKKRKENASTERKAKQPEA